MSQSMLRLNPYLFFGGNCREAMQFYQSIFGGELSLSTFGESPANVHADPKANDQAAKNKIMHANLTGPVILLASDDPHLTEPTRGGAFSLSLEGADEAALSVYFQKLAQNGAVQLPLSKQFWGDTFGMVTDKFGIRWMVSIKS